MQKSPSMQRDISINQLTLYLQSYFCRAKEEAPVPGIHQHNFVRTHFARATHCDYCGKKIWLKEAAQCQKCNMSCHKKCIKKCQMSTVCTISDANDTNNSGSATHESGLVAPSVEFKLTESDMLLSTADDAQVRTCVIVVYSSCLP